MPVSVTNSQLIYDSLKACDIRLLSALPETWLVHLIRMADDDPDVQLVRLAKEIQRAAREIENESEQLDFVSAKDRLLALAGDVAHWVEQQTPEDVYWIESSTSRGRPKVALAAAPMRAMS